MATHPTHFPQERVGGALDVACPHALQACPLPCLPWSLKDLHSSSSWVKHYSKSLLPSPNPCKGEVYGHRESPMSCTRVDVSTVRGSPCSGIGSGRAVGLKFPAQEHWAGFAMYLLPLPGKLHNRLLFSTSPVRAGDGHSPAQAEGTNVEQVKPSGAEGGLRP